MDLGMNEPVPEYEEDNGNSVLAEVLNHTSNENMSANGLLLLVDDDREESIGSPQQSNNVDSFNKVEAPGGSVHSTRKGFGLRKWRRIKRDGPVKDEASPIDDGSKLLKRGLTGSVNPPSKHVDLSSIEARQSSEGSVGSVNMLHHPGIANGFSPDPSFMFTVGQAFEKSEEHSNSIGAKKVGGKLVSGSHTTIKKEDSEERVKTKKEKPCTSMDSDLRSSDFVFSSGAVSVANHREKDREEVQTYSRSENGDKEDNGDESKKNNHFWADKEQFAALQEALWKEVQSFQELSKEAIALHSNMDGLGSSDQPRNEKICENNSTSSGSQVLILKQKVKHLENTVEETRAVLEAKERRIQELENSQIESELEGVLQRRIETEIEHLVLTRSQNSSLQVLKQPEKLHPLTEDPELNRGNMLRKTCKFGFCLLTQLILLVFIFRSLVLQFSPASQLVTPT